MKYLIIISGFLLLSLLPFGCSEKSSEEIKNTESSILLIMKKIDSSKETISFTGKVISYEGMVYPRFQFELRSASGEEKTVWFNSVDFEGIDEAISEREMKGKEITVVLKDVIHLSLASIYFPEENKTYTKFDTEPEWLKEKEQYKVKAKFLEEVILNNDIYEEWTKLKLDNGEIVKFEDALEIEPTMQDKEVVATYYYDIKEEVIDVKLDQSISPKEKAIGKTIALPLNDVLVPIAIAQELYTEVLNDMDPDEDIFEEFKDNPASLFLAQEVDLNDDGKPELIVTKSGENNWCYSHNCPIWIYGKKGNSYNRFLASSFISYEVLEKKKQGFYGFLIVAHGSASTNYNKVFEFENGRYIESRCIMVVYNVDANGNETVSYEPCK
ncbi:MAG: hypothetical protein KKA84_13825 [Bacteroidetes bacterium]|nr:hypothetical protein [Bacteroidota bacterium]